jgi:hypothetical protein
MNKLEKTAKAEIETTGTDVDCDPKETPIMINTPDGSVNDLGFEGRVWDKLSHIDVDPHVSYLPKTNKRPAIPYLPWHKAWMLLVRAFPASQLEYDDHIFYADQTVEVGVRIMVQTNRNGPVRFVQQKLAVMNSYFGAIENPTAREINDARQRCLVKAIAMTGLGLNLWSESVEPVGKLDDPITPEELEEIMGLIKETDSDMTAFLKWCRVDELVQLPYERLGSALAMLDSKKRRMAQ